MSNSIRIFLRMSFILSGFVLLLSSYFIGYSAGKSAPAGDVNTVTLQQAQRYTEKYRTTAPMTHDGIVNALVVDVQQYNAMTDILQHSVGTAGFRIYFGVDDNNQFVRVVSGFGPNGKDNTNYLMATSTSYSGLCPPVCDSPGGIAD
ncbi:MAG TPA: hypothetical protein P5531_11970 [Bacteroidales bacterium]|nr:hypothetical protein [Bacteroidales bacterium]